ncbi:MAG: hypothetical protein U1E34_00510 [Amaricoccus sp.]
MTDETRRDAKTQTGRSEKDRRLAEALRANLARRKAQSRNRRSEADEAGQKTNNEQD